jgi:hypothetical protein
MWSAYGSRSLQLYVRARSHYARDTLASMRKCKQPASLKFRALISDGVEHLELVRD